MLERASTGWARGLSLVAIESRGFRSSKQRCSGFLKASTAWPLTFQMHLPPHSYFAGIPAHEMHLSLSTQYLGFFPTCFLPKREAFTPRSLVRFLPQKQQPKLPPAYQILPCPLLFLQPKYRGQTLPPPRQPGRIGARFFGRCEWPIRKLRVPGSREVSGGRQQGSGPWFPSSASRRAMTSGAPIQFPRPL